MPTIGRRKGGFRAGESRTVEAARKGGRACAALIDEEARRQRSAISRRWWAQFTSSERREIARQRTHGFANLRPHRKGWTLELPADHPALLALRANGIAVSSRYRPDYLDRVRRAHQAFFFEGRTIIEIAVALKRAPGTIRGYLNEPLRLGGGPSGISGERRAKVMVAGSIHSDAHGGGTR